MDWSSEEVDETYAHVLGLQVRYYSGDTAVAPRMFQWLERDLGEPLRTAHACSISSLYKEDNAAYYLAMQRHAFREDSYMSLGSLSGRWFTPDFYARYSSIITPSIRELMKAAELNEQLNQSSVSASLCKYMSLLLLTVVLACSGG
jgi:hypothetical protein